VSTRAVRGVLIDALGTLVALEPPVPALRERLRERLGLELSRREAERAMQAEIAFYRAHILEGGDMAGLVTLRRRCAQVLRDALPGGDALPLSAVGEALTQSLRFRAFRDAPAALDALRARGLRVVVVSNWDVSLRGHLAEADLLRRVHGVICSAEVGVAKPDPAIFAHALTLAGVHAEHALHVGDSLADDVAGARVAGIEPVLLARGRARMAPLRGGVRRIGSLSELPALIDGL
jgi:putative hydrolase of the HAD superfamily